MVWQLSHESLIRMKKEEDKKGLGYFFDLREVLGYYFRKKDPNRKPNINLRMMHCINKIAIFMFLAAMLYLAFKYIFIY